MGGFDPPDDCSTQSPGTKVYFRFYSGVAQLAEPGIRNAATGVRFSAPDPNSHAGLTERFRWQSSKLHSRVGLPDSAPVFAVFVQRQDFALPVRGHRFESGRPLQVRVSGDNGNMLGLHPRDRGSIPRRSTKCGRSRVVQAAGCEPVHESSILSGHPSCARRFGDRCYGSIHGLGPWGRGSTPRSPTKFHSEVAKREGI